MSSSILFTIGKSQLTVPIIRECNNFSLDIIIGELREQQFSDGEFCVDFISSVRGKKIYILSTLNNSNEIIKLCLAIDAAKRAGAMEIIPILPYFIYARGDKKDQSRGPIAGKMMAEMIEQRGATSVITFDLHADQIQGFFTIPVIHIQGKNVFDTYIKDVYDAHTILCSPDAGGGKRVKRMKDQLEKRYYLQLNYVMLDKTRSEANVVDEMVIIGDVRGKNVIIIDDMVDTAGTLCKAAEVIMANGAKSVRAVITHGICSGAALARIENSVLTELVISDSLPKPWDTNGIYGNGKITVVSVGKQIGMAIASMSNHLSYEELKNK
jgi:ribose-phosphate pyrophosphokinase